MSWIILALTLGASITSIIHGVFMLFGSLTISGAALFGLPSTMIASLPIISAVFALIGGIVAFNRSKWGALFLFIAGGLCIPARDTWFYGGIYFFAGILCFLLKADKNEEYQDILYDDVDYHSDEQFPDENNFYEPVQPVKIQTQPEPQINNEPPQLKRRASKVCPECGAIVARENRFCPNCGTKLFVIADNLENIITEEEQTEQLNEQLLTKQQNIAQPITEIEPNANTNFKVDIENVKVHEIDNQPKIDDYLTDDGDEGEEMAQDAQNYNYRMVKPVRNSQGRYRMNNDDFYENTAMSYEKFSKSKYARRAKKRKRSPGRKILSMLLLVSAVGGGLYFLLGLRKLPPGDLPPIARNDVRIIDESNNQNSSSPYTTPQNTVTEVVAQPQQKTETEVNENILPNFVPDTIPKSGMIVGSNVNVRADHTTSSNRITRLNVNSKVDVIGTFNVTSGQYQGIWYNIETGGREGWVYGRYLQPLGSGLPSGYSNALLKSFGDNRSQLVEALGNPSKSSNTSVEWSGLTANLRGQNITRIRITNSSRELQNGLKVGMSRTALYQIMGYPSNVSNRVMQYNEGSKTGLSVQLDRNDAISVITVSEIQ